MSIPDPDKPVITPTTGFKSSYITEPNQFSYSYLQEPQNLELPNEDQTPYTTGPWGEFAFVFTPPDVISVVLINIDDGVEIPVAYSVTRTSTPLPVLTWYYQIDFIVLNNTFPGTRCQIKITFDPPFAIRGSIFYSEFFEVKTQSIALKSNKNLNFQLPLSGSEKIEFEAYNMSFANTTPTQYQMNTFRIFSPDLLTNYNFGDIGSTLTQNRVYINEKITGEFIGTIPVNQLFSEVNPIRTDITYRLKIENVSEDAAVININFSNAPPPPEPSLTSISITNIIVDYSGQSFTVQGENLPSTEPTIYFSTSSSSVSLDAIPLVVNAYDAQNISGEYNNGGIVGTTYYFVADYGNGIIVGLNTPITFSMVICFKEGSKILCLENNTEVEIPIQDLKRETLVKTYKHGYLPVNVVGRNICYNPKNSQRLKSRLFKLKKEKYPELKEDLIVTGCHSILESTVSDSKEEELMEVNKAIYLTDDLIRLPAYLDDRSEPYVDEYGDINVYHVALGNDESTINYGIYANGLLVESCFIQRIKNQMTIIS
jgi:hypothetical protein